MGKHINSLSKAVRLPTELWEVIDAQAEAAGESRNRFLAKRIDRSVRAGHSGRKTVDLHHKAEEDELPPLEETE